MAKNSEKNIPKQINVKDLAVFRIARIDTRYGVALKNKYPSEEGFSAIAYYKDLREMLELFLAGGQPVGGFQMIADNLRAEASYEDGKTSKKLNDNADAIEHMCNRLESIRHGYSMKCHMKARFERVLVKTNGTGLIKFKDGLVYCYLYFGKPELVKWEIQTIRQAIYQVLIDNGKEVNHHQVVFYDVPRNYWSPMEEPDEGCWGDLRKTIKTYSKIWDDVKPPAGRMTLVTEQPYLQPTLF